jgi:predicted Zn-dependent peptidase
MEGYYATAALSGMPLTVAEYMAAVEAVTIEQVAAAARTLQYHSSFFLKGGQQ